VFDLFLGRLMTLDDFDLRLIATEVRRRRRGSRGVPAEGTHDAAPFAMTFRYTDVWVPFAGSREAAGPDRGPSHAVARVIVAKRSGIASTRTDWESTLSSTARGISSSYVSLTSGTMSIAPRLDS
jgi:hypothetical protein